MDTLRQRFARLWPHIVQFGPPDDEPRPAVILFHGCGGVRDHLRRYAMTAARAGFRAFLVDSFTPRGWTRRAAASLVCTGLRFRGRERSGDVLAAAWGLRQLPGVDPSRLALAGWSHGAWAIMELMSQDLTRSGGARLSDPEVEPASAVKSLFLAYPYVGLAASSPRVWRFAPRTFAITPLLDHLASVRRHMKAYAAAVAAGAGVEVWGVDATHAFDEPGLRVPRRLMRYDPDLSNAAQAKFESFLVAAL